VIAARGRAYLLAAASLAAGLAAGVGGCSRGNERADAGGGAGERAASAPAGPLVRDARIGVPRAGKAGEWTMPAGDYASSRYSELDRITPANAKNLRVAWALSTGVLRGHEGQPLVVDNTMYVVTPYPNVAYATLGYGVTRYIVLSTTRGPPSCPRSTPVENAHATRSVPAFAAVI